MVRFSKAKAHITEEMVREEKYTIEEKEGNDGADEAADIGAEALQPEEGALAKFYARRHWRYQNIMGRVQNFILKMRTKHKEKREALKKEANPTRDEQKEKRGSQYR